MAGGEKDSFGKRISHYLVESSEYVEKLLAAVLIIGVLVGFYILMKDFANFNIFDGDTLYDQFRSFISFVLILVIALELCEMLLNRRPGTIIEIFFLAITRKLLVYSNETYELVLGVVALAGVFAIRKYLFIENFEPSEEVILGGCTLVKDANTIAGVDILRHEHQDLSLTQLIHKLARNENRALEDGITFSVGNAKLTVLEMNGKAVSRLRIKRLN